MKNSLLFIGPESLTLAVPTCFVNHQNSRHPELLFQVNSFGADIAELKPPYDFDIYLDFFCESFIPSIDGRLFDGGLLIVLCLSGENDTVPLATWGCWAQTTHYAVLICMVLEDFSTPLMELELPVPCRSDNSAAVAISSDYLSGFCNTVIGFSVKSSWGHSLQLLIRELGV